MRRLITLSVLALLIGLTGYQASAANERSSPTSLPKGGNERGVASFPAATWNTGIQVQNPTTSPATVQVKFYAKDGTLSYTTTPPDTIVAGDSKTYYLPAMSGLTDGKYSGVVESDQAVVVVVNETNYAGKGLADAYNGITSGATQLNLPLIFRGYSSWDSMVALQNTDASASASVALKFYKTGEATPTYTKYDTVAKLASNTYDISSTDFSSLGSPFVGSLVITSTASVAAVAHSAKLTSGYDVLSIYRGFTQSGSSTRFLAPLVFNQYSPSDTTGWLSGIQVQNLGSTADTITMTLTLSGQQSGTYTKTQPVGASSSVTFWLADPLLSIPAGTYGSAVIQSGSNQIVVIVNTTKYATGVANAYNAFPDGAGSKRVVAPLVYSRYNPSDTNGWVTGIQVQNLGSSADTVTMVYKPGDGTGPYTKSQAVAASSSVTFWLADPLLGIPAGTVGSAEFTSTSQNIIAVVNTTKYASSVATTYTGTNE